MFTIVKTTKVVLVAQWCFIGFVCNRLTILKKLLVNRAILILEPLKIKAIEFGKLVIKRLCQFASVILMLFCLWRVLEYYNFWTTVQAKLCMYGAMPIV
jgi:hypothetical protein